MSESPRRVLTVAPLPPEKVAYALARYSRSPDSIAESIEWVRTHDSSKFLDSFYFQYGHASIADLGHLVLCFEGISELAATEIEDEQLWDGQARSSRYQDFGKCGFIRPPDLAPAQAKLYDSTAESLLKAYRDIHATSSRTSHRQAPAPGFNEAGRICAKHRGAGVRYRTLLPLFRYTDRRRTGRQHSERSSARSSECARQSIRNFVISGRRRPVPARFRLLWTRRTVRESRSRRHSRNTSNLNNTGPLPCGICSCGRNRISVLRRESRRAGGTHNSPLAPRGYRGYPAVCGDRLAVR